MADLRFQHDICGVFGIKIQHGGPFISAGDICGVFGIKTQHGGPFIAPCIAMSLRDPIEPTACMSTALTLLQAELIISRLFFH